MQLLFPFKQSTAGQVRCIGQAVDPADFVTPAAALTLLNTDMRLSKNGTAMVDKNSGGGTALEAGFYAFTFDATDTSTVGEITGNLTKSGMVDIPFKSWVLEESIYQALWGMGAAGFDILGRVDMGAIVGSLTAAQNLSQAANQMIETTLAGTPSTTVLPTNLGSGLPVDAYKDKRIYVIDGAAAKQERDVLSSAADGTLTVNALASTPVSGNTILLV